MGGGIGVPPILELAKQMQCEEKQIVVGYRDAHTFLKEEFEQTEPYIFPQRIGSVGTKRNVIDAIREQSLDADIIFACGPTQCCERSRPMPEEKENRMLCFPWKRMACGVGACLCVCKTKEKDTDNAEQ